MCQKLFIKSFILFIKGKWFTVKLHNQSTFFNYNIQIDLSSCSHFVYCRSSWVNLSGSVCAQSATRLTGFWFSLCHVYFSLKVETFSVQADVSAQFVSPELNLAVLFALYFMLLWLHLGPLCNLVFYCFFLLFLSHSYAYRCVTVKYVYRAIWVWMQLCSALLAQTSCQSVSL